MCTYTKGRYAFSTYTFYNYLLHTNTYLVFLNNIKHSKETCSKIWRHKNNCNHSSTIATDTRIPIYYNSFQELKLYYLICVYKFILYHTKE